MAASEDQTAGRVVCLGEALVDLVCEQPVAGLGEAPAFVPRPGGSLANIAVCAARFGARVEMLGGAGDDEWGRWLRERIAAEGVGVERFVLMPDGGTSHAFVAVSPEGEPRFAFYGDPKRPAAYARADLDEALAGEPGVLVVGSDTLIGAEERETTLLAAELGRERGWQVLCDPNLRPNRWPDEETMLRCVRELVARSSVVKCNESEAGPLAGRRDARGAASGLLELGPEVAVVTRSARGALLASDGVFEEIPGHPVARVVDATGAGDCVAGVLAAALARGFESRGLAPAVAVAMRAAAGVVERWGATTGLPVAADARAALTAALPTTRPHE
jgi:fructokinase